MAKIVQGEDNGTISPEEAEKFGITSDEITEKGIPEFWKNAISNAQFFPVNDKDKEILIHLKNIELDLSSDKLDFTINFYFETNEFFDHQKLSKTYIYDPDMYCPVSANATEIEWKEGKNPTLKIKTKKIKSNKIKIYQNS